MTIPIYLFRNETWTAKIFQLEYIESYLNYIYMLHKDGCDQHISTIWWSQPPDGMSGVAMTTPNEDNHQFHLVNWVWLAFNLIQFV